MEEALRLAKHAAGDKDVKIGGGASTVWQYLRAGLIDSAGLEPPALGFSVTEHTATEYATHFLLERA
jgi:hypothetical protein